MPISPEHDGDNISFVVFRIIARPLMALDFKFCMQLCMGNAEQAHK